VRMSKSKVKVYVQPHIHVHVSIFMCPCPCDRVLYGESCAVLRHNYPCTKAFLLSWNCPFKRLFSSHKYIYVCLTMCSPLKEWHNFSKYVNTLRVKMAKKSPED
jgi:hypothetical protein